MKKIVLSIVCLSVAGIAMAQGAAGLPGAKMSAGDVSHPATNPAYKKPSGITPVLPLAAAPDPDAGVFKFKQETHDFGTVMEGPNAEYDFEFKNTGKKPIVISEAHGSCGCTVPKWSPEPVLPKQKGVIHVSYNTHGRVGMIDKEVIITSNAQQNPMKLHITGMVKADPTLTTPQPPTPPPAPVPEAH